MVKGLFEIGKFQKMGLKEGKWAEKSGSKKNFHFGVICGKKSEKGG